MNNRTCGDCRLCCKVFELPYLNKPAHTWCVHACSKGCAIYDRERHEVCKVYKCLWLSNESLPDEYRPDRCGVLVTYRLDYKGKPVVVVSEAYASASSNNKRGARLIELLAQSEAMVFVAQHNCLRLRAYLPDDWTSGDVDLMLKAVQDDTAKALAEMKGN